MKKLTFGDRIHAPEWPTIASKDLGLSPIDNSWELLYTRLYKRYSYSGRAGEMMIFKEFDRIEPEILAVMVS